MTVFLVSKSSLPLFIFPGPRACYHLSRVDVTPEPLYSWGQTVILMQQLSLPDVLVQLMPQSPLITLPRFGCELPFVSGIVMYTMIRVEVKRIAPRCSLPSSLICGSSDPLLHFQISNHKLNKCTAGV